MTDRDYFAGCALMGELAAQGKWTAVYVRSNFEKLAERSFELADAMMKHKQKELWPEIREEEPCRSMSG